MAEIIAVVTDLGRALFPQMLGGLVAFSAVDHFKIAEGGWIDPGGGKVPRLATDARAFTDVDAVLDVSRAVMDQRYPADSRAVFQKSFVGGDLTYVPPTTLRCRCFLDFGEFNNDGFGNSPELWELGVFDAAGNLLGYGPMPIEIKDVTKQLENFMRFVF